MGTTVEVTFEGGKEKVSEISKRLFDRIEELETKFSLYNPESEIVLVNKKASREKVKVSPDFFELLEKCLVSSELTSGAFDISVAPLVKLWGFKEHSPLIPKEEEIKAAISRCGYGSIMLSPKEHEVSFSKPGVQIDMNAIAKGFIVDEAVKFLRKEGVDTALINAGGDIYCMGAPHQRFWRRDAGSDGWKVGIQHPRKKNKIVAQLTLRDKAVATSGDYENFFEHEGEYLSHIIDPRTGWPSKTGVISATVISSDCAEADALATALVVMGKKDGIDLINHLSGVEAIIISLEEGKFNAAVSSQLEGKVKVGL